jgi:hypothetical protein
VNDGQFVIRGFRLVTEGDPPVRVWHQVISMGGGGTPLATFDSTGMSDSLDWSPDGRYIGFIWGGEAQGAPPPRVTILDLQVLQDGKPTQTSLLSSENLTGLFRFSPDSSRFVAGVITDFNFNQGVLSFLGVGGSGRTNVSVPGWNPHDPIWWQPGTPVAAPARLELAPDPVVVWGESSAQTTPTLFDANGNVIVRAASAWSLDCFNGSARVTHTGLVTGSANVEYTGQVCASNGRVSDCSTLQSFPPVLSVSATTPETVTSGAGGPGVFTITRAGALNSSLVISFTLGGTAARDVDYTLNLGGNTITMAPSQTSVTINVEPTGDSAGKGNKNVTLTLQPDPSNSFTVDTGKNAATVTIKDDGPPPAALSLSSITPNKGGDAGTVTATIYGANIQPGATATLKRTGFADIIATNVTVAANGFSLTGTFDLTNKQRGAWDVVVTNPGNATATLAAAFTIEEGRDLDVWADIAGRYTMRSSFTQRFYIAYGNNGNNDAPATHLRVVIPMPMTITEAPTIEGSQPYVTKGAESTTLEYMLSNVPANSSSFAPMLLTAPPDLAHQDVEFEISIIGTEEYQGLFPQIDPTLTATVDNVVSSPGHTSFAIHISGDSGPQDFTHDVTITQVDVPIEPTATVEEIGSDLKVTVEFTVPADEMSTSVAATHAKKLIVEKTGGDPFSPFYLVRDGIRGEIDSWKRLRQYNSEKLRQDKMIIRNLRREVVHCLQSKGVLTPEKAKTYLSLKDAQEALGLLQDHPNIKVAIGAIPAVGGEIVAAIEKIEPTIDKNFWRGIKSDIIGSNTFDPELLAALGAEGNPDGAFAFAILKICAPCAAFGDCPPRYHKRRLKNGKIVFSADPNDKSGPLGAGTEHFITGIDPANYSIMFENVPTATAPAQKVVITDQLDTSKLDLSTFSLGAFGFGDTSVTAPPGLSDYTTDVDLRPAQDLIVRINAQLDKGTGLLTVQFTSLDPATMQPTTDPLAGFLPPNKKSPEGQGSIVFSVKPKTGLPAGTEIRNKARIVFDTNAPIDTAEWLNTIDNSKPASQVSALDATQNTVDFTVNWSGTDAGSGITSYTVYVSEDGGPYQVWQVDTTATSANFTGGPGKTYAFYSIATDGAGNSEDAPSTADAATFTKLGQTITVSQHAPASAAYNASFTVAATSASGLPVTYSSSGACTNSGSTFTMTSGTGTCTVKYDQAGDANHAAIQVTESVTAQKASQTITFAALANKTFGDADFNVSATASSGLDVSFSAAGQCTVSGTTVHLTGAGSCTITGSQGGNANYSAAASVDRSFTINKGAATVTLTNLTQTYDGTPKSVTATTGPAGLDVTTTYSHDGAPVTSPTNAGAYNVTVTVNDSNYQGSQTSILVINKATPVITWNNPAGIPSGTPLSSTQLNAMANVPGTFQYNPPAGTVLATGTHQLSVTFTPTDTANHTAAQKSVQLSVGPAPGVELTQTAYSVGEGARFIALTVTRTGDLSGASTIKYQTSDQTDVNFRCDPATQGQVTGLASRKCDYHITSGRLRFATGESTKQIVLSLVDDVYVEGPETLTLTLSSPTIATIGGNSSATITIVDNDVAGQPNPIDQTRFFVRQLYVDLLSREPEQAGWDGWANRIDLCGQPGQAPPPCDRVTAGGDGFLRSAEFFDRQFFVIRLYRTGLGRILVYDEVDDLAYVSGFLSPAELEMNKQELVSEIMSGSEFSNNYNGTSNPGFVDAMLQTAGVTVPQGVRDGWVSALDSNSKTRAQVYREISERPEVSSKYLTEAQVVSAYYGFFTRNPDGAYFNLLDRLNRGEINLGDLANVFINAAEYRQRFGP